MAPGTTNGLSRHLHRAAAALDAATLTDGELLDRYVRDRDDAAFEGIVRQHGPMVWGVCRRVLGTTADAEDAFQATFLVLVRKAPSVVPRSRVGNWLFGVALNTAKKAAAMNRTRRAKEAARRRPDSAAEPNDSLVTLLDEELQRLPESYRAAVVCCELDGRTIQDAARHLGWPAGTVAGRLARARKLLADRLTRRGITLPAAGLGAAVAPGTVSAALTTSTVRAAAAFAVGTAAPVSAPVLALTEGVLKAMFLAKLKVAALGIAAVVALAATLGVLAPAAFSNPAPTGTPQRPTIRNVEKDSTKLEWKERLAIPHGPGHQTFSAAISAKGDRIAAGTSEGAILYDAVTGREVFTANREVALSTAFAPDGKSFASGHTRDLCVWDRVSGKQLFTVANDGRNVSYLAYSPDGKWLAVRGITAIVLVEAQTGKLVSRLGETKGQEQVVYAMAFAPDSKKLISADGPAKTATVWDLEKVTGAKTFTHQGVVTDVAYAPDGRSIAVASGDGLVTIWDLESDKPRAKIEWKTAGRHSLAYSPDGTVVAAAGGRNNVVKLFDAKSGKELRTLEHTGYVVSVSYAADGHTLVTGGDDAIRIWEAKK
jgi:RNA polymerase sigma factor (sigma-70 family)